ncbi:MAG: hypothetical protein A3I26_00260 [Candidatus Yanofskybacteria bacterium RIFCSPLOWO2_02_FULL_43_10]|nr:MAG: hypothetical protein A3C69_03530 [Candidatus Yanofskybacteria bacterium RIFCSPHIGHO2_02_FULL_43_12]OGN30537.1 MAG: hypothetical protein A3I26_00260 [Candidatus Yanofskybacteria bacterium RIFCSPLOWO2_02_FULL_43_10]
MFMRFQEYYESPEFKGKTFSIDEFVHWYTQKHKAFTYTRDWYGFNIPASVLQPFRDGQFDPLTTKERNLLKLCEKADTNSYIIGVTPSAEYFKETVKHEFVHGAFHVDRFYRDEVKACLLNNNVKEIVTGLKKMGYHEDVFADEANAYVLIEPETIQEFASISNTKRLREDLRTIFQKHFGFSILDIKVQELLGRVEHVLI